jgi:hypothetical protein
MQIFRSLYLQYFLGPWVLRGKGARPHEDCIFIEGLRMNFWNAYKNSISPFNLEILSWMERFLDRFTRVLHARHFKATQLRTFASSGAEILTGGSQYGHGPLSSGNFVQPTIAIPKSPEPNDYIWKTETFAPILKVAVFDELEEAIEWNNGVPQV